MNIKILVCCHKDDVRIDKKPYFPIHVGKALSNVELNIQGDNTGDNISFKNASYCELTGIYWTWKNLKDVDYIGLCHYRRYFDFNGIGDKIYPVSVFKTEDIRKINFDVPNSIINKLQSGEVVVPKPIHYLSNLYLDYCERHYSDDIKEIEQIIGDFGQQEYIDAYKNIMYNNNKLRHFNMFLMEWTLFDKYCNWLFQILEEAEKRIDISNYNPVQKRIYGYISERLLNVFLLAEKRKVYESPVLFFSDSDDVKISKPKYFLNIIRAKTAMLVTKKYSQ